MRTASCGSEAQMSAAFTKDRRTRLVATGYFSMKAVLAKVKQQKYCDQGGSMRLLTTTRPTFFSCNSCDSGGKTRSASILPSLNNSKGVLSLTTQLMSLTGSRP